MNNLVKEIASAIKTEKTKAYDTLATVLRIDDGTAYVHIDGGAEETPAQITINCKEGDTVRIRVSGGRAWLIGNITAPPTDDATAKVAQVSAATANEIAVTAQDTANEVSEKVTILDSLVANKANIEDLSAQTARIDTLSADNVTIQNDLKAANADIANLETDNATIKGNLDAANASIKNLETDKLSATDAALKYATIDNLDATNANVDKISGDLADFQKVEAEKIEVVNASIEKLETDKLSANDADIKYATIANLDVANANITKLSGDYADFKLAAAETVDIVNASIDNLQANKLSAADAALKYANIDFSNIGKAAMEYLYTESGLIRNVTIGDATITGNLVGVTISGDLIEGNTIKAEKLVVKGSDGLYYKLNTDGMTTTAEQTDYNSLNGQLIQAKSITAEQISVNDLVAFDATIGGFNITDRALYSGVKESVDNTTRGIYMDNDGQLAIGDADSYLKYYKDTDGTYKLAISAASVMFSASKKSVEETVNDLEKEFKDFSEAPPYYTWIAYADDAEGTNISLDADGKAYMGTAANKTTETVDISDPSIFKWVKVKGEQGEKGEDACILYIDSSRGTVFKNDNFSTVLSVVLFYGASRITTAKEMHDVFGADASLKWYWQGINDTEQWEMGSDDTRFSDEGFKLTLSPGDVDDKVTFFCELIR